ncbi:MAG: MaoC/PaaZ C-terminal domain-containing protein [Bdellovibrionota bacterium]
MNNYQMKDMKPGMSAKITKTITKEMMTEFGKMTGDLNPFHEQVAHGLLTSSIFSAIAGMHLPGKNALLMSTEFQFVLPVIPGDELNYEAEITSVNSDFKFIDLKLDCTNQNGLQVIRGKMRVGVKE